MSRVQIRQQYRGNEADLTTANRTTTPAIDSGGACGQGAVQQAGSEAPEHNGVPKTGDIHDRTISSDPDWKAAQKQAAGLGETCGVDASTRRFALLLPDGRVFRFDDRASQGIAKQLKARAVGHKSIYRVQVAGKLQKRTDRARYLSDVGFYRSDSVSPSPCG